MVGFSPGKVVLVVLSVFGAVCPSYGAIRSWLLDPPNEDRWLVANRWSGSALPTGDDEARIVNGGTALIQSGDSTPVTWKLYVGCTQDPSQLSIAGQNARLRAVLKGYDDPEVYIGYAGAEGTWPSGRLTIQSGGELVVGDTATTYAKVGVAYGDDTQGVSSITDGRLEIPYPVIQYDPHLFIAHGDRAEATVDIKGGSAYTTNVKVGGLVSTGGYYWSPSYNTGQDSVTTLTVSDNARIEVGTLELSQHPESHTDLTMTSGEIKATGGSGSGIIRIANRGSAEVTHTGGTISATRFLHIAGHDPGAYAHYVLDGPTAVLAGGSDYSWMGLAVGEEGTAEFEHKNGTCTSGAGLYVGSDSGGPGPIHRQVGLLTQGTPDLYSVGSWGQPVNTYSKPAP